MQQKEKQDIKILQSFLKLLPQGITVRHIKRSKASSRTANVKRTRVLSCDKSLSPTEFPLYEQLVTELGELGDDIEDDYQDSILYLMQTLAPKYSLGSQLQEVVEIERINFGEDEAFTKEDSSFCAENGIVYLIDVWATWCGPCQASMDHNQELLEKNPDWKGKAKIIGISIDGDIEGVVKKVNAKKWKSIEHYRLLKGWDDENDLIKFLQIRETPFVLLLNKWGKIVYIGHPSKANLEEKINSEINAEQDSSEVNKETLENKQQPNELLSKDEYKQLKERIISLQKALNVSKFEGSVKVSLEKINLWIPDGTKEILQRSKLTLCYDVDVSEEEKINNFLQNHWNTVPENLRQVQKAQIRDPLIQQKENQEKFKQTFATLGVTISYPVQDTHKFIYHKDKQSFDLDYKRDFSIEAQNLTRELVKSGLGKLNDYLEEIEKLKWNAPDKNVIQTLVSGLKQNVILGVGKKFETIENYQKWESDQIQNIEHQPGQVLVILYWVKQSKRSVLEIEKITKFLQQNGDKLGNSVRVVSLCIQQSKTTKDFTETHKESQEFIEFYFPIEEDQPDAERYDVGEYPHYVIVDKYGTIRQTGTVEQIEKFLTSLLNEQVPWVKEADLIIDIKQIQQIMSSNLFAQLDPQRILEFQLILVSQPYGDLAIIKKSKLSYFARDTQELQLKLVFDQLFQIIPENQWTISQTISKTISIPYPGKVCAVCNKDILNQPQQYYSPFKTEYVCAECAEADDKQKKGNGKYKYLDTLVFINGPLSDLSVLNNIDDHKIGNNRKLPDGEKGCQHHEMKCNGCDEGEKGPRYISVTARPGRYQRGGYLDYCHQCFLQMKDKTSEKAQDIIAKTAEEGMVLDSLFTRVLFNYGEYKDF